MKLQRVVILGLLIILNACGGGGGSGGSSTPAKTDQAPLIFAEVNIEAFVDSPFSSNSLNGGSGTGIITYSSSNANVASVNSVTGVIKIISAGQTVISATKAADSKYNPATTSYNITINLRQQQPLVFAQSQLGIYLNTTVPENVLDGGSGEGAITYSSSDKNIVGVNSLTGKLEPVAEGHALITAIKAADNIFAESSASYEINVEKIIKGLEIGLGVSDTKFKWQAESDAVRILRSTDVGCNFVEINSCADNNDFASTTQTSFIDALVNLYAPAYFVIESKGYRSQRIMAKPYVADVSKRYGTAYFVFAGKVWAMGGAFHEYDPTAEFYDARYFNDLWSSVDGVSWRIEKEDTGVETHYNFQVINFRGELYLLGGFMGEGSSGWGSQGIWKSKNASDWELIQNSPPFGATCAQFYTFKDKLWCYRSGSFNNEIWSSTDGVFWEKAANVTLFNRSNMAIYVINDKLFMAGGCEQCWENNHELKNDIWSSTDGVTWNKEIENANFPPLERMKVIEFKGKWILTGGALDTSHNNKSLISDNGINWLPLGNNIIDEMSWEHEIINFKDQLYLYSDVDIYADTKEVGGTLQGYIWKSDDGKNWRVPLKTDFQWIPINN